MAVSSHTPIRSDGDPIISGFWWAAACFTVIGTAICLRAWILFRTPLPPGIDAGYYPMQARGMLERGWPWYDDPPVRFAIDAAVAKGAIMATGWETDAAVLWSSRVVDSLTQPWVAAAMFLVGWTWSRGKRNALLGVVPAAALAVLSRPIMDMTGDFQKQSLAMVWTAWGWVALWMALRATRAAQGARWGALAFACALLAAGTHVGTFGGFMVGTSVMLGFYGALSLWLSAERRRTAQRMLLISGCLLCVALVATAGVWWFSPRKAEALISAPLLWIYGETARRNAPGGGALAAAAVMTTAGILTSWAMWSRLRYQSRTAVVDCSAFETTSADAACAIGMVFTVVVLWCPLWPGQYAERVGLIGILPAALVITFIAAYPRADTGTRFNQVARWVGLGSAGLLFVVCAAGAAGARGVHQGSLISMAELKELQQWREELATDIKTIVVAPKGVQWWVGYAMHTAVRMERFQPADADRYERFLIIVPTQNTSRRGPGDPSLGPPPEPPGDSRAWSWLFGPPPRDPSGPRERPGPWEPPPHIDEAVTAPHTARAGAEPDTQVVGINTAKERAGTMRQSPGGRALERRPVMHIPDQATILRKGRWFTLYQLPQSSVAAIDDDVRPSSTAQMTLPANDAAWDAVVAPVTGDATTVDPEGWR